MGGSSQNSAKLQNGIIYVTQIGDQSFESIDTLNKEVFRLAENLKEVKVLVDHRRVGHVNIGARRAAFQVAKHLPYDKMAFYGTSPYMTGLINLLARSVGKGHTVHFANSRQEALQWLK